jgi:hypothetical protein
MDVLSNVKATPSGPSVMLPDSTNIQATHSGQLPLHHSLSSTATKAHILDGITNSSLVSLGQLCDDNCIAVLDKKKLQVFKSNNCVLQGARNKTDGLWDISLPLPTTAQTLPAPPAKQQANAIIRKDLSKTQLVRYLHGCCGSPVISTWKKAIRNGNFITWPGIDVLSIDAHLPKSVATAKGHLNQERKNLQSTRKEQPTDAKEQATNEDDFFPLSDTPNVKTFEACAAIVPFVAKNTAYHDLTGRFPHRSSRGNEYLLIVYDHEETIASGSRLIRRQRCVD